MEVWCRYRLHIQKLDAIVASGLRNVCYAWVGLKSRELCSALVGLGWIGCFAASASQIQGMNL